MFNAGAWAVRLPVGQDILQRWLCEGFPGRMGLDEQAVFNAHLLCDTAVALVR